MNSGTHLVSSNTLVDVAYHNIRKDIIEEYLPAGQKINLSDLCTRYGVSPTPIKQALNRLMAEGLWRISPQGLPEYGLSTGPSWMRYLSCA
ncbi:MAG: GntR family transcriptional regulator [Oscillospiraceae bacterium]